MKRFLILFVTITACLAAWAAEGYAVYTPGNTTLTFYYGEKPDGAYSLNQGQYPPDWKNDNTYKNVTRVVFDSSFAQARPIVTAYWFCDMTNLTTITNLNYLNTSEVLMMCYMFAGCKKLTSLDLSNFNTSKVFNMSVMFNSCIGLTSLDLSSFNTAEVNYMTGMFSYCSNLKTIIVSSSWSTAAVTNSSGMFTNCSSIVGGAGTTFDENYIDASYAHLDGGPSNPGYFASEMNYDLWINGAQVTSVNSNNLSSINGVSGTVTYNPSSKTLTLDNARLSCGETSTGACIRSHIDGLTINVTGTSVILVTPSGGTNINGMVLSNTTITGTDTLAVQGRKSGITILDGKTLTINNLHSLIARGSYGIYASSPTNDSRLVVKGSGTHVLATGNSGAIRNMNGLYLEDGLKIIEPVGGYFTGGIVYDASGNVATRVTISNGKPGDVNGDGVCTSSDVTALYNYILYNDNSAIVNGDQNGDNVITSSDVTAVYNIILGIGN